MGNAALLEDRLEHVEMIEHLSCRSLDLIRGEPHGLQFDTLLDIHDFELNSIINSPMLV